jgi:CheY-like chemotaxis protein
MRTDAAVLLVDDDTELRDCVQEELQESGFDVRVVGDGEAALELLRGWLPDLIVLDLNMPTLDGWEFRVRQMGDARLAGIPVLATSADPSAKAAAIDADGFLRKPFSTVELLSRIGEILTSARRARLQRAVAGGSAASLLHEINNALSILLGGLELVAIGVGDLAPRPSGAIDCGSGGSATLAEIRNDVDASRAAAQQLRSLTDHLQSLCRTEDGKGSPAPSATSSASNRH